MRLLNVGLIKQPINWVTVLLMLIIAGIGGHFILSYFRTEPASQSSN